MWIFRFKGKYNTICITLYVLQYNRQEKTENILTDDQESKLIKSFFENGDKCNLTEVKWDATIFEWSSLIHANFVIELLEAHSISSWKEKTS